MKKFLLLTLLVISSLLYAEDWTGTGWALKNGYIVTNFHCVDGAKSIVVETSESHYSAKIVATDPSSDLAIIKIYDDKFRGFGEIPYSIERKQCEVGETVWTLGFPMTSIMGNEVKFTDGKISSRTGYMGDLSTYQITVPIHPGNSGGPLFNKNGNVVGVTSSGLDKQLADNVNYAIKSNYLLNLIESSLSIDIIPNGNIKNLALTEYIQRNKQFVFKLHFSNELRSEVEAEHSVEPSQSFFEYVRIANNKVKITKYVGSWQEVEIPSIVTEDGIECYVTEIGERVFKDNAQLRNITMPNTIETIGKEAFFGCSGLTSIIIPKNVISVGAGAFTGCTNITRVVWNAKNCTDLYRNGFSPFYDSRLRVTSFIFGNEVEYIPYLLCCNMPWLTCITIPNSVIVIEEWAFAKCSNLTHITIPNSVRMIGNNAFNSCTNLKYVSIPNSVTIGEGTFYGCPYINK